MWLSCFDLNPRDPRHRQRSFCNEVDELFEVTNVSSANHDCNEIVEAAIVDDSFRPLCRRRPADPDGNIHFYRLGDLRLVGKHTYVRVEAHRFQRYDVLVNHLPG